MQARQVPQFLEHEFIDHGRPTLERGWVIKANVHEDAADKQVLIALDAVADEAFHHEGTIKDEGVLRVLHAFGFIEDLAAHAKK